MNLVKPHWIVALLLVISNSVSGEDNKDTREGQDVTLPCRFEPDLTSRAGQSPTYYWQRSNHGNHDNVAIEQTPLHTNYRLDFQPEQGRYDLVITNVSYGRDNGRFECRVKAGGSGRDLHAQDVTLTVLTAPGAPNISPGPSLTASEGRPFNLSCSSSGGSPSPELRWFKEGFLEPLEGVKIIQQHGIEPKVSAVLTLTPTRSDDGQVYKCQVSNRAMPEGTKLENKVALSVNYYPRVEVGPENPLRVELDGTATLHCTVQAKPKVTSVRWTKDGRFVATSFQHTIEKITLQDAGLYKCTASNGLEEHGEAEMRLDVLFSPIVQIESQAGAVSHRQQEEGESLTVKCNVTANPVPDLIEWLREGHPEFRQQGEVLHIARLTAESAGQYTCRAVNMLEPSLTKRRVERVGNASFSLLVRHKPGRAHISPVNPVATEGTGVTLTCSAMPPGWPAPEYRWWRDVDGSGPAITVLATGHKYTIPSALALNEGRYHCQASNEMGPGDSASVMLIVNQPPRFTSKLHSHVTKQANAENLSVFCRATGKPKPLIRWLKDGFEITTDPKLYEMITEESEDPNQVFTVKSTFRFMGMDRPSGNRLIPGDRGVYSCVFENEVKRAESTMHLRIEHKPIRLHQYDKVAYDIRDTALVVCKVQAYPRPEFQWSFGTHLAPLGMSSEGHYEINTKIENGDVYTSILKISDIRDNDYGDYICRIANDLGTTKAIISLQPKGPPENPRYLVAVNVGHNFVTLRWEPGFDGGLHNTKYFVAYKRVTSGKDLAGDCPGTTQPSRRPQGDGWQEFDCQKSNPCNVTALEQHNTFLFKVKAYNPKGSSNYSEDVRATSKVDRIPAPQRVAYDPENNLLSLNVAPTCLQLLALVEAANGIIAPDQLNWRLLDSLPMAGDGNTRREVSILPLPDGQSFEEEPPVIISTISPRVRVKLCLASEVHHCSEYTDAEIGPAYIKEASSVATPTVVAIVVSGVLFFLFIGLLYIFCRCKRTQNTKGNGKDFEMETSTVRPSLVTQQPPPPYYPPSGMENKALENSLDLALDEVGKPSGVYGSQNGYGYHGQTGSGQGHINGVNMGYMDNSYSNSNNGGSVNSQDSLWQMKMASAGGVNVSGPGGPQSSDHHHHGYDPLTHGGYGTVDDYASYPQPGHNDHEYGPTRNPGAPSRHSEYAPDPYAAILKPKKRMEPHLDGAFHDVSGLPDPYIDPIECDDNKPHISLSFDESLESGYSTPNSRNRRVIREIIV